MFFQIYIWDFKNCNDLIGVAFIDTQLYIHTAISVKNLIFIADVSKSVTLLRFQVNSIFMSDLCLIELVFCRIYDYISIILTSIYSSA